MRPRCTVPATTAATSAQCDRGCSSAELTRLREATSLLLDRRRVRIPRVRTLRQVLMIEYPCS